MTLLRDGAAPGKGPLHRDFATDARQGNASAYLVYATISGGDAAKVASESTQPSPEGHQRQCLRRFYSKFPAQRREKRGSACCGSPFRVCSKFLLEVGIMFGLSNGEIS